MLRVITIHSEQLGHHNHIEKTCPFLGTYSLKHLYVHLFADVNCITNTYMSICGYHVHMHYKYKKNLNTDLHDTADTVHVCKLNWNTVFSKQAQPRQVVWIQLQIYIVDWCTFDDVSLPVFSSVLSREAQEMPPMRTAAMTGHENTGQARSHANSKTPALVHTRHQALSIAGECLRSSVQGETWTVTRLNHHTIPTED